MNYSLVVNLPSDAALDVYQLSCLVFGYINDTLLWTASNSTSFTIIGSNLHDYLWYQNKTLANMAAQINSIHTRVTSIETNLSLYNEIQDVFSQLTTQLSDLEDSLSTDPSTLRPWLQQVLGTINKNLTATNKSLNENRDELDASIKQFYSDFNDDLTGIKTQMKSEHDLLNDTINSLDTLDLSEINSRLTTISIDLSTNHKNLSAEISKLGDKIDGFQVEVETKLAKIDQNMDDLDKLEDIISKLEILDGLLGDTEKELTKQIKETKTETGGGDINTILLVIILMILIIIILMNFLGKTKGIKTNEQNLINEPKISSVKDRKSAKKKNK